MEFTPLQSLLSLFGYGKGKDNFTQTQIFDPVQILNGKQPLWVTIKNKEEHVFQTTPELYSVIMRKATMYSNGVFKHYKVVNGEDEEVENSEVIKLLNNPNPLQSRTEWMIEEMVHSSIFGSSFVYGLKGYNKQNVPTAFYNLPAGRMQVIPTGKFYQQRKISDIIDSYRLMNVDGSSQTFEVNDVIYSRTINTTNPLLGLSPLHSLQMPISNIRGAYGYRNVIIEEKGAIGLLSGGNGKGVSGNAIPLSSEDRNKLEKQYNNDYGTSSKKNKVMITNSPVNWQPMTYPTKDLMLFEEITADLRIIIDVFGMNEYLFGKEQGSTYANLAEGKRMAYQDCIIPYANDFTSKLTTYMGLDKLNEKIVLDYSHIEALQDNEVDKTTVLKNKVDAMNVLIANGYSAQDAETIVNLR